MNRNRLALWVLSLMIVFSVALVGCGGDGNGGDDGGGQVVEPTPQDLHGGSIKLLDNTHIATIDLADGYIKGVISETVIHPEDVESISFNSDRVGWKEESVAVSAVADDGSDTMVVTIPNTASNDIGTWTLKTKDGNYHWFNIDQWTITEKLWLKENNLIKYGSFTENAINFSGGIATIDFGGNVLSGLMKYGVNPNDVSHVQWNSDRVGWFSASSARGLLQQDVSSNYFVEIGVPNNDKGNFLVHMKDGADIWLNIDKWRLSTNAEVNHTTNQIEYIM